MADAKKPGKPRWKPDPSKLPPLAPGEVRLLSGGNPQIPKGDGPAPVTAYIAAMPGWKRGVGETVDRLVMTVVPDAAKAVRWNQPFWGVEGGGWMLSLHCLSRYVKVAFYQGTSLAPMPPVESKHSKVRYLHVFEDGGLDEAQFSDWVRQAAKEGGAALF